MSGAEGSVVSRAELDPGLVFGATPTSCPCWLSGGSHVHTTAASVRTGKWVCLLRADHLTVDILSPELSPEFKTPPFFAPPGYFQMAKLNMALTVFLSDALSVG